MDHLVVSSTPQFPLGGKPKVPYVCADRRSKQPYDGGAFMTYPERVGKPRVIPSAEYPPFWYIERLNPSDDRTDLEPFLQSWVFFGLLHEFLSPFGLYDANHYITGSVITTARLPAVTNEWVLAMNREEYAAKRGDTARHLLRCLKLADWALRCLWIMSDSAKGHPDFDRGIRLSLATICESFTFLGETTFIEDELSHIDWPSFSAVAELDARELVAMREAGWCPNILRNAKEALSTVAGYYYFRSMPPTETNGTHERCTDSHCTVMQIRNDIYQPRHVTADCSCDLVGPELQGIADCLDAKTYPVLKVTGDSLKTITIDTVPYDREAKTPYVAFSHVWADGLGNPWTLELPQCQVLRLASTVEPLRGRSFKWQVEGIKRTEDRDLLLWCDSLLCPITMKSPCAFPDCKSEFSRRPDVVRRADLYEQALGSMKEVYENSAYTIVLDWSLLAINYADIDGVEAMARIVCSGWAQRLWTYQESVLPAKILFQFKDTVIDLRDIGEYLQIQYRSKPLLRGLHRDLLESLVRLRDHPNRRSSNANFFLVHANVGLRGRSVAADEPVCITTLLGMDSEPVIELDGADRRMAKFWQQLGLSKIGIADNIIFNNYPRLKLPGYGWAPATFERAALGSGARHIADYNTSQPASLQKDGLIVRRSGWRIRLGKAPWFAASLGFDDILAGSLLHVKGADGMWYTVGESASDRSLVAVSPEPNIWDMLQNAPGKDWIILLEHETPRGISTYNGRHALMGFLQKSKSGKQVFKMQRLVTVNSAQTAYAKLGLQAELDMPALRRSLLFRRFQLLSLFDWTGNIFSLVTLLVSIAIFYTLTTDQGYERWQKTVLLLLISVFLPEGLDQAVRSFLRPYIILWNRQLRDKIISHMRICAGAVYKNERLNVYFGQVSAESVPDGIFGYFAMVLVAHFVRVHEILHADTEWCVD